MQKVQRFRFVAIIGLVVALTTAGFALAGDNIFDTSEDPQPTVCPPTGGTVDEGDTTDATTDDGDTDEGTGPSKTLIPTKTTAPSTKAIRVKTATPSMKRIRPDEGDRGRVSGVRGSRGR